MIIVRSSPATVRSISFQIIDVAIENGIDVRHVKRQLGPLCCKQDWLSLKGVCPAQFVEYTRVSTRHLSNDEPSPLDIVNHLFDYLAVVLDLACTPAFQTELLCRSPDAIDVCVL
jgi:hypothetical protein